jgi:hypothetical protein
MPFSLHKLFIIAPDIHVTFKKLRPPSYLFKAAKHMYLRYHIVNLSYTK